MFSMVILIWELVDRARNERFCEDPNLWLLPVAVIDIYLLWGIDKVFF